MRKKEYITESVLGIVLAVLITVMILNVNVGCAELKAFVTNTGSNSVSEIDLATGAVSNTYPVGTQPVGIGADKNAHVLYVANSGSQSVTKIDLHSGITSTLTIPGSEPESITVSPVDNLVLVTSMERITSGTGSASLVYVIDSSSFTVLDSIRVADDPEDDIISEDGHQAWIASDEKIRELELKPSTFLQLTGVISGTAGIDDFEELAVVPDKSVLFATKPGQTRVDVISLSTETIIATIATGADPESVVLRPGGEKGYITNQQGNSLTIFSQTTYDVVDTMNLSLIEARGIAFMPDGSNGYVVMSGSNSVIKFDPDSLTELDTISVGTQPEEIIILDVTALEPTPTPIAHYDFTSDAEGWSFTGQVNPYDQPQSRVQDGHIGLSPNGSTNCFSYWSSPHIEIDGAKPYRARWIMGSTVSNPDQSVNIRLRGNNVDNWLSWLTIVNSINSAAPSSGDSKMYDLIMTPAGASGSKSRVPDNLVLNFDIMSFEMSDDTSSWLFAERVCRSRK